MFVLLGHVMSYLTFTFCYSSINTNLIKYMTTHHLLLIEWKLQIRIHKVESNNMYHL